MPKAWTNKDERMFDHVKQSELERGRTQSKAAEIAGRTEIGRASCRERV